MDAACKQYWTAVARSGTGLGGLSSATGSERREKAHVRKTLLTLGVLGLAAVGFAAAAAGTSSSTKLARTASAAHWQSVSAAQWRVAPTATRVAYGPTPDSARSNSATAVDPAGDSGNAPDVTDVAVANDYGG